MYLNISQCWCVNCNDQKQHESIHPSLHAVNTHIRILITTVLDNNYYLMVYQYNDTQLSEYTYMSELIFIRNWTLCIPVKSSNMHAQLMSTFFNVDSVFTDIPVGDSYLVNICILTISCIQHLNKYSKITSIAKLLMYLLLFQYAFCAKAQLFEFIGFLQNYSI